MSDVVKTTWCGLDGLALESERLGVIVLPQLGGKIVSLFDKAHRHEWLVSPMRPLKPAEYGADFVSQDMSGWDEMMPTINRCRWEGRDLPDHGEVWSIPWTLEERPGALALSVTGKAFPYHFRRVISFVTPDCLEFRYSLVNNGPAELSYLWAAHPQFVANAHTRILLPPEVEKVVNVVEGDPLWGPTGRVLRWPQEQTPDGQIHSLDRVGPVEGHICRKVYLLPERPVSWAALEQEDEGCRLRLEWDRTQIPYLGIWVDEGAYNSRPVAALEPSNAFFDSLEWAAANRRLTVLQPGGQITWALRLYFGD